MESRDPVGRSEAPGDEDFYVEPACCLLCGVPEDIAPEIFETGDDHCFVKRQPYSQDEIDRTVRAMWSSEVDCIRYRGRDPFMLERLARADLMAQADFPMERGSSSILRDTVSFAIAAETDLIASASLIADRFRGDMRTDGKNVSPANSDQNTVGVCWFQNHFHHVRFLEEADAGRFVALLSSRNALRGLSWLVDDWLRARHASAITWYMKGDPSSASPTPM